MDDVTRSLVLALGVCYHACLKNREEYREAVAGYFRPPLQLTGGADQIDEEISKYVKFRIYLSKLILYKIMVLCQIRYSYSKIIQSKQSIYLFRIPQFSLNFV